MMLLARLLSYPWQRRHPLSSASSALEMSKRQNFDVIHLVGTQLEYIQQSILAATYYYYYY